MRASLAAACLWVAALAAVRAGAADGTSGGAASAIPRATASAPAPATSKAKAASSKAKASGTVPATRAPSDSVRRAIAGAPTEAETSRGPESPELQALRDADRELFAPASPGTRSLWPSEWPFPQAYDPNRPAIHASGFSPRRPLVEPPASDGSRDLGWLRSLALPEIPVRWDARVVRYLEYYRNDPRGRALVAAFMKKSGRYAAGMRKTLRAQLVPDDLVWVSLVESAFDPTIRSPAGAAGLWQLMPAGAKVYGLIVDRWIDERLDPDRSTEAAARYLSDLHRRFGAWELALAAYNMGYGGLLASIHKYNTNDYWELARYEAGLPWETMLYVPKIFAMAIVARNFTAFGIDALRMDPPLLSDEVTVRGGVSLRSIAAAAGVDLAEIESLNPQIRAGRTPPAVPGAEIVSWRIRVPPGKGTAVSRKLSAVEDTEPKLERYVTRLGETIDSIAAARNTTRAKLQSLNALRPDEGVRPGAVLLLPPREAALDDDNVSVGAKQAAGASDGESARPSDKPVVVVPANLHAAPGKKRVFYRVVAGDTLDEIAEAFRTAPDDLLRWNAIDPTARLHDGMVLQALVPAGADLSKVLVWNASDVRTLVAGTDEFLAYFEALRGRRRIEVKVREGDTWEKLGKRYDLTVGQLERINRRSRTERLAVNDSLIIYAPIDRKASSQPSVRSSEPAPLVPMVAPSPEDLPALPDLRAGATSNMVRVGRQKSNRLD